MASLQMNFESVLAQISDLKCALNSNYNDLKQKIQVGAEKLQSCISIQEDQYTR